MKAAINGVLNLSITDGWWAEACNGKNGWAITPRDERFDHHHRLMEEAHDLLNILQGMKYVTILRNNSSQRKFIRGWLRRVTV